MAVIPWVPPGQKAPRRSKKAKTTGKVTDDAIAKDPEKLKRFLESEMASSHAETRTVLEALRLSRKSRGGSGAPLSIPVHLSGGPIIVTDADLDPNAAPKRGSRRQAEELDRANYEAASKAGLVPGEEE